ncbi:MAG: arylmalonate decarboxylase [Pseudomonadota bacterium]
MISRRKLLAAGAVGAAATAFGATAAPILGLILPVDPVVPPEAAAMYPKGIHFQAASVGLKTMTPQGYDQVLEKIAPVAKTLGSQGAQAIILMGTSLSFYKGAAFNRELTTRIATASGLPATTMSTAVTEGLRSVGGKRLAVATAYDDEVNRRLQAYLHEEGFEVLTIKGMGIQKVEDILTVTQEGLQKFCVGVSKSAPGADAMLVSCGGLRTLDLIAPLEQQCRIPVVSSLPHALRAGVRLLGLGGRAPGYGRLLSL